MRRPLVLVLGLLLAAAGCKTMRGIDHAAGTFGQIASRAAGGINHAVAPVTRAVSRAAPTLEKVGSAALEAGATVGEALAVGALESAADDSVDASDDPAAPPDVAPPASLDLCLDCPDAGNCNSCVGSRDVP